MREILFRGKHFVSGKTVYGCYLVFCDTAHLIVNDDGSYRINPETVGQYTGMTDKNGVKIFEGDILGTNNRSSYIWIVDFKASAFCANQ